MKALPTLFLLAFAMQSCLLRAQVSSTHRPAETDVEAYSRKLAEEPLKHYRGVPARLHFLSSWQDAELVRKRLEEALDKKSPSEKAAVKYMIAACHKSLVMNAARWDRKADLAETKRSALSALLDAYALAGDDAADKRLQTAISSAIARWLLSPRTDWMTGELEQRALKSYLNALPLPSSLEEATMLTEEYRAVHSESALAKRRDDSVAAGLETFDAAYPVMCITSVLDGPEKALPYAEDIMARFAKEALGRHRSIIEVASIYVHTAPEYVEKVFGAHTAKAEGLYAQLYLAAKAIRTRDGGMVDYGALLAPVLARLEADLPADMHPDGKTRCLLAKYVLLAKDLCRREEFDASIFVCDAAFRLDPDGKRKEYWEALNCKALCHEKCRRFPEARECYGRCAEDDKAPSDAKKVARRALQRVDEMGKMKFAPHPQKGRSRTPETGTDNGIGEE
ncbi:MAG: hypothetical protein IJJ26_05490 [Victivallales bacterium]|nr:hypothetical protein [Victivallales bacterium]